ncbi:MAG: hypothetical protein ABEI52_08740 [Halobacteriaceae archaeon]
MKYIGGSVLGELLADHPDGLPLNRPSGWERASVRRRECTQPRDRSPGSEAGQRVAEGDGRRVLTESRQLGAGTKAALRDRVMHELSVEYAATSSSIRARSVIRI